MDRGPHGSDLHPANVRYCILERSQISQHRNIVHLSIIVHFGGQGCESDADIICIESRLSGSQPTLFAAKALLVTILSGYRMQSQGLKGEKAPLPPAACTQRFQISMMSGLFNESKVHADRLNSGSSNFTNNAGSLPSCGSLPKFPHQQLPSPPAPQRSVTETESRTLYLSHS